VTHAPERTFCRLGRDQSGGRTVWSVFTRRERRCDACTVFRASVLAHLSLALQAGDRQAQSDDSLALMPGWTGVDFSKCGFDEPIHYSRQDAQTSALEAFTIADPNRKWTVREIAKHAAIGGRGPVVVGSPGEVADEVIAWVEETDVDGFNLAYAVTPETFADFIDLVVPELQRRGRYKLDYAPGTLREKLYGPGRARLGADHTAARF
jgi:alkanesulfonate monooxygenase